MWPKSIYVKAHILYAYLCASIPMYIYIIMILCNYYSLIVIGFVRCNMISFPGKGRRRCEGQIPWRFAQMISPFLRWDGTHARSFQRLLIPRIFSKTVVFNPCSLHSHEKSFCSWTCIPCSKMSASQVLAHLQISLDDAGVVSMAFAGIDGVLQTPKAAKINKRMFKTTKPSHI